jgi:glycosyltransferase involved in cell wall biosynthesis
LAKADLSISLGTTGSLDKTIVEAMASGCPVISCNDAFRAIAQKEGFSECVIKPEENDLNRAVSWFASMDAEERLEIARKQSMIAHRDHTLDGLILRLVSLLNSFAPKTKP